MRSHSIEETRRLFDSRPRQVAQLDEEPNQAFSHRTLTHNFSNPTGRAFALTVLFTLCAPAIYGQTANTGAIAGSVSDPSGALVPHATVVVNSQTTGEKRNLLTDAEGNFSAQFLTPGNYDVEVRAAGFEPFLLNGVQVQITEVSRLKIQLTLSGSVEQVTVTAKPLLLQTENAALGRVIDRNTIEELPLVNRNFTQILGLTAGTNTDIVDATQLGPGSQEIRANGARSGDNNFMLNGVDANSYSSNITEVTAFGGAGIAIPAPDTIEEFKVQTSLYDAQYGRGGGANVNVETRSGTADVHGTAYYFGRNEALDANNFFANATGVPRGEFRRSQPGGTLGGPIPWSKKRAFFFVSYQTTRDLNAASLSNSVRSSRLPPIPQVRTRGSLGAVFGGQTGAFGGVAVARDGSNINPVALNLLNAKNPDGTFVIPSPQTSGAGVNYTAVVPGRFNEDQFNTNLDFSLRAPDRLSMKFFFSNSDEDVPFFGASVPGFPALRSYQNRNLAIVETHSFSPRAINQFRFGFSRLAGQDAAGGTLTDQDVGINHFSNPRELIPQIQVLGAFQVGNSASDQSQTAGNNFYASDIFFLSRGKHNLRFGAEFYRNQLNSRQDSLAGNLILLSFPDLLLGLPSGSASDGGNGTPLSNIFLSGVADGAPSGGKRASAVHLFVLDDWKASRALTINLGLRVEVNGQYSDAQGRQSNFFPQFYVAPPTGGFTSPEHSGFVLPDNYSGFAPAGFPRGNATLLNDPVQVHPEPRIGFAWQPFSSKDLVIRGGYGIYANRLSVVGDGLTTVPNLPFTWFVSLFGGANAAASLQKPFPNLPPPSSFPNFEVNMLPGPPFTGDRIPRTSFIADPALKESTIQQFGLDLQYQHKSYVFSIAYAGAKGTHLGVGRSNNQPALASPSSPVNGLTTNSAANAAERVPFLGLTPLQLRLESSGNLIYNSLQATLKKDLSHGFQMLAAYTFSKSIDDAGDSLGSASIGGGFGSPIFGELAYNDQNHVSAQRGVSDFDRTHRFVLNYTWNLPLVRQRKSAIGKFVNGWALSGIMTFQSGLPFSIVDSAGGTLFGSPTLYITGNLAPGASLANASRSGSVSARVDKFFNTAAFVPAPFLPDGALIDGKYPVSGGGTIFGNLGRNILRGPDQRNIDIAVIKTTSVTENAKLIFRWEMFNLLNTPNFANPGNDVSTPATFGVISALSVNPRIMQYAMKLVF